jgi:hypothetical protein
MQQNQFWTLLGFLVVAALILIAIGLPWSLAFFLALIVYLAIHLPSEYPNRRTEIFRILAALLVGATGLYIYNQKYVPEHPITRRAERERTRVEDVIEGLKIKPGPHTLEQAERVEKHFDMLKRDTWTLYEKERDEGKTDPKVLLEHLRAALKRIEEQRAELYEILRAVPETPIRKRIPYWLQLIALGAIGYGFLWRQLAGRDAPSADPQAPGAAAARTGPMPFWRLASWAAFGALSFAILVFSPDIYTLMFDDIRNLDIGAIIKAPLTVIAWTWRECFAISGGDPFLTFLLIMFSFAAAVVASVMALAFLDEIYKAAGLGVFLNAFLLGYLLRARPEILENLRAALGG